jgi:8-oxo-dGTP diphosphatase
MSKIPHYALVAARMGAVLIPVEPGTGDVENHVVKVADHQAAIAVIEAERDALRDATNDWRRRYMEMERAHSTTVDKLSDAISRIQLRERELAERGAQKSAFEQELQQWKTWGVIEIAVRNPNVAEYMSHWEGRAEKAEAENVTLRSDREHLLALANEYRERLAFWKDAPAAELPRLVACAVIVRDGKILLEKRVPAGIAGLDGAWDLPGGKVEARETPQEAVEREIYEEMGVRVRCVRLLPEPVPSVWTYAQGERHWLLVGCVCEIIEGEPNTNDRLAWFAGIGLPESLLDADRRLIEDYISSRRGTTQEGRAGHGPVREFVKMIAGTHCKQCEAGVPVKRNSVGYFSHREDGNHCTNHTLYADFEHWEKSHGV